MASLSLFSARRRRPPRFTGITLTDGRASSFLTDLSGKKNDLLDHFWLS
jgi:hypothetical protein